MFSTAASFFTSESQFCNLCVIWMHVLFVNISLRGCSAICLCPPNICTGPCINQGYTCFKHHVTIDFKKSASILLHAFTSESIHQKQLPSCHKWSCSLHVLLSLLQGNILHLASCAMPSDCTYILFCFYRNPFYENKRPKCQLGTREQGGLDVIIRICFSVSVPSFLVSLFPTS